MTVVLDEFSLDFAPQILDNNQNYNESELIQNNINMESEQFETYQQYDSNSQFENPQSSEIPQSPPIENSNFKPSTFQQWDSKFQSNPSDGDGFVPRSSVENEQIDEHSTTEQNFQNRKSTAAPSPRSKSQEGSLHSTINESHQTSQNGGLTSLFSKAVSILSPTIRTMHPSVYMATSQQKIEGELIQSPLLSTENLRPDQIDKIHSLSILGKSSSSNSLDRISKSVLTAQQIANPLSPQLPSRNKSAFYLQKARSHVNVREIIEPEKQSSRKKLTSYNSTCELPSPQIAQLHLMKKQSLSPTVLILETLSLAAPPPVPAESIARDVDPLPSHIITSTPGGKIPRSVRYLRKSPRGSPAATRQVSGGTTPVRRMSLLNLQNDLEGFDPVQTREIEVIQAHQNNSDEFMQQEQMQQMVDENGNSINQYNPEIQNQGFYDQQQQYNDQQQFDNHHQQQQLSNPELDQWWDSDQQQFESSLQLNNMNNVEQALNQWAQPGPHHSDTYNEDVMHMKLSDKIKLFTQKVEQVGQEAQKLKIFKNNKPVRKWEVRDPINKNAPIAAAANFERHMEVVSPQFTSHQSSSYNQNNYQESIYQQNDQWDLDMNP